MLQWQDTARDYIERTNRAQEYIDRCEEEKADKKEKDFEDKILKGIFIALPIMIALLLSVLPKALDAMIDKQEESVTVIKQIQAETEYNNLKQGQ